MQRTIPGILALWLGVALTLPADVAELLQQAKSTDPDQRRNAFRDLGDAGAEAGAVLPTLVAGLHDPDRYVRRFAAQALGKLDGVDGKKVVPAFNKILADRSEPKDVQEAVANALSKMGAPAVDPLAKLLRDHDRDILVRQRAAESLGRIGRPANSAVPALLATLNEKGGKKKNAPNLEGNVRLEVVNALGQIATKKNDNVVKALEGILGEKKNRDRTFKAAVNKALKTIKKRN